VGRVPPSTGAARRRTRRVMGGAQQYPEYKKLIDDLLK
jgi:hypothetical protein